MADRFYHHPSACDCDDTVNWQCPACCIYSEGKREGIAEGICIERARVIAHLDKFPGCDCNDWLSDDFERGEHAAEGGE